MIEEDYVSFEIAKLLREKGFEGKCHNSTQETTTHYSDEWNCSFTETTDIPTLQMAMKWLREEYKIFICIVFLEETDAYGFTIENISSKKYLTTSKNDEHPTYEKACEVAIKYCLENLI